MDNFEKKEKLIIDGKEVKNLKFNDVRFGSAPKEVNLRMDGEDALCEVARMNAAAKQEAMRRSGCTAKHALGTKCPTHGMSSITFACKHCISLRNSDVGIVHVPNLSVSSLYAQGIEELSTYFLCFKCFQLLEAKKLVLRKALVTKCLSCVQDEIVRIGTKNPDLYRNLAGV